MKMIFTSSDDVHETWLDISRLVGDSESVYNLECMQSGVDLYRRQSRRGVIKKWEFVYIGVLMSSGFRPSRSFEEMLYEKHKRYGAEPILRWGNIGVIIRIDSKLARLSNLVKHPDIGTNGESISDTLLDIAGYCFLGYAANKKGMMQ